jgi:hypothetical protein
LLAIVTVAEIFAAANLTPCGPVSWGTSIPEKRPGVYLIQVDGVTVYGKTKRPLAQRLREFYGHKYGNRAPHRGGQLLLTLPGERSVYWAATDHFRIAEHLMLEAFAAAHGVLPIANKIKAIRERAAN